MSLLVLDCETLGDYPEKQARAIAEMAAAASGRDVTPEDYAALSPPLARVVCVGFRNLELKRDFAVWDRSAFATVTSEPTCTSEAFGNEDLLLEKVNAVVGAKSVNGLVTFNGRNFDLPLLVYRMVAWNVRPAPFLLACARQPRYKGTGAHVDLREQFTFQGAANGNGTSLRAFALGYGFDDPKAGGDGAKVASLIETGNAAGLVGYCLGDVRATAELYERWQSLCGVA